MFIPGAAGCHPGVYEVAYRGGSNITVAKIANMFQGDLIPNNPEHTCTIPPNFVELFYILTFHI